eukprot:SAG11_NODE_23426_length_388_cov_5.169550_1_plen_50_part_00
MTVGYGTHRVPGTVPAVKFGEILLSGACDRATVKPRPLAEILKLRGLNL